MCTRDVQAPLVGLNATLHGGEGGGGRVAVAVDNEFMLGHAWNYACRVSLIMDVRYGRDVVIGGLGAWDPYGSTSSRQYLQCLMPHCCFW